MLGQKQSSWNVLMQALGTTIAGTLLMTMKKSLAVMVNSITSTSFSGCINYVVDGSTDCVHGDVRLQDGTSNSNGRIEICQDRRWVRVCMDGWDVDRTRTVCNQLNFTAESIGTLLLCLYIIIIYSLLDGQIIMAPTRSNDTPNLTAIVTCADDMKYLSECRFDKPPAGDCESVAISCEKAPG